MKSFEFVKEVIETQLGQQFDIDGTKFTVYGETFDPFNRVPQIILLDEEKDVYFPVSLNFFFGLSHQESKNEKGNG